MDAEFESVELTMSLYQHASTVKDFVKSESQTNPPRDESPNVLVQVVVVTSCDIH
jgi:hypothetical protein